ncbi:MAG: hypothetical protein ACJAT1_001814 [Marivirga sp.]|jgi:hypothetical protein
MNNNHETCNVTKNNEKMTQLSEKIDEQKHLMEFDLIKGEFSVEDAREILLHMIQKKIEFHEMKIFSNDVRFGKSDDDSINRIEQLRKSKNQINMLLKGAKEAGKTIRINSSTQIELL